VTSFVTVPVVTQAGVLTVDQQLMDRAGPGFTADQLLGNQLTEQLHAALDTYALNQASSGANLVVNNGAFSLATASGSGGFYEDLSKAREALADTAGTRLRATHIFSSSDFANYVFSLADSSGRPILTPCYDAQPWSTLVANGDPHGEGWAGHLMPGGLAWFYNDNIPAFGTSSQTQILVSRPGHAISVFESAPKIEALLGPSAGSLEVTLRLTAYIAVAVRRAAGTSVITGAAYASLK